MYIVATRGYKDNKSGCAKITTPLPGGGRNRVLTEFLPVFYLSWFPKNIIKYLLKRLDTLISISYNTNTVNKDRTKNERISNVLLSKLLPSFHSCYLVAFSGLCNRFYYCSLEDSLKERIEERKKNTWHWKMIHL